MKILGIGNDIIEIDRIKKAIDKSRLFTRKVFTKSEIKYIETHAQPYQSYAGRFAAKEAVFKSFGTGIRYFTLLDIEILNDKLGKPKVFFKNEDLIKKYKNCEIHISISHSKNYALATAILVE